MVKNQAFVFIKPHAVTEKVKELVKATFEAKDISIVKEGEIGASEIDQKMLIDKHYYSIAAKATLKKPSELNVPKEKFAEFFGIGWDEALEAGKVFNAKDACEKLSINADELDSLWAKAKKDKKLVKFGGGFYCAELPSGDDKIYAFNGFFMSMRSKYVAEGTSIYYYIVEWDSKALSWADFRGKVLGPTDPAQAPEDSARGAILAKWKDLDLKSEPNVGDNGLHASASPFEAFAERVNWLGHRAQRDPFGKQLLKAGVPQGLFKEWSNDVQVTFGALPITKSIFDTLEDTDTDYCLALCQMIASFHEGGDKGDSQKLSPQEKELAALKEQLAQYEALGQAVAAFQSFELPDEEAATEEKTKKSKSRQRRSKRSRGGE